MVFGVKQIIQREIMLGGDLILSLGILLDWNIMLRCYWPTLFLPCPYGLSNINRRAEEAGEMYKLNFEKKTNILLSLDQLWIGYKMYIVLMIRHMVCSISVLMTSWRVCPVQLRHLYCIFQLMVLVLLRTM